MKRFQNICTETSLHPDGSATTVTVIRNETKNRAQIIITTQNRTGMYLTTTQTVELHKEHSA